MAARRSNCQGKGMAQKDDKADRLAAALRDNLRKRKAQARELDERPGKTDGDGRDPRSEPDHDAF
jgi:hypothetical protein